MLSKEKIKTGHTFKTKDGEIVYLTLSEIFKDRNRGYDNLKKMKEVHNKWTQPIKDKGYNIDYDFADGFYSAYIYYPHNKKQGLFYIQQTLNNFYENMYINFINNN
jgi:hypothetical protein